MLEGQPHVILSVPFDIEVLNRLIQAMAPELRDDLILVMERFCFLAEAGKTTTLPLL